MLTRTLDQAGYVDVEKSPRSLALSRGWSGLFSTHWITEVANPDALQSLHKSICESASSSSITSTSSPHLSRSLSSEESFQIMPSPNDNAGRIHKKVFVVSLAYPISISHQAADNVNRAVTWSSSYSAFSASLLGFISGCAYRNKSV